MKISIKTLIIVAVSTLAGGLLLGWLFFGGSENGSPTEHNHETEMAGETTWTCSMHPQIRSNEPGACPICGMDLIPVDQEEGEVNAMAVSMSPTAMQLASISTDIVGKMTPIKSLRLNGKVQEDERLVFSQSSHIPGRIEKLMVNFTGEYVSKGKPIAYIYSPNLVTAQEELFEAVKIKESQPALYQAARSKLKNWKLTDRQIDNIISTGRPIDQFPINADISGYVTQKKVNLGDYINKGQSIYEIANLSKVWVLFDIYESDMPWVKKGDLLTFTVASLPGEEFEGKVTYIDPLIDPKTRVAKARLEVSNNDLKLKPEMFVSGTLEAQLPASSDAMIIPKTAVMWTGERSVVYVKETTGTGISFLMREVKLGPALGTSYIIEEGLEQGEEIAVNGTFSIDAAAQLAGKPSMMNPDGGPAMTGHNHGGMTPISSNQTDHSQHQMSELQVNESEQTYESDPAFREQLQSVFSAYLQVKDALIESDVKMASEKAEDLRKAIDDVDMKLVKGEVHMEWMDDLNVLQESTDAIRNETELEKARMMLSPLSNQLFHSLKKYKVEVNGYRQFCPMAFDNTGGFWLSDSDKILNPYFGDTMLTCGNVEEEL